jgi:hypothetical protein
LILTSYPLPYRRPFAYNLLNSISDCLLPTISIAPPRVSRPASGAKTKSGRRHPLEGYHNINFTADAIKDLEGSASRLAGAIGLEGSYHLHRLFSNACPTTIFVFGATEHSRYCLNARFSPLGWDWIVLSKTNSVPYTCSSVVLDVLGDYLIKALTNGLEKKAMVSMGIQCIPRKSYRL